MFYKINGENSIALSGRVVLGLSGVVIGIRNYMLIYMFINVSDVKWW